MNIEQRVIKMEERLKVNQAPETMDGMIERFEQGNYGKFTMMSIVAGALSSTDREGFFEGLKKDLPAMLVNAFRNALSRSENSDQSIAG
ncbi:MAG: hypothetical protein WC405_07140 [Syntrophales bacterium]